MAWGKTGLQCNPESGYSDSASSQLVQVHSCDVKNYLQRNGKSSDDKNRYRPQRNTLS